MYEITMAEAEEDEEGEEDDDGQRQKKPPPEPEVKMIWRVDGLAAINEDKIAEMGEEKAWFGRELHSAVSIQDRFDKERNKGIKKEEVFKRINEHYFFMDDYHIYKIDKRTKDVFAFENQNIAGLFLSDNNYLYTLSHKRVGISSGFRLYDIWNCISTGSDLSYQLSRVQVGCQPLIDFSIKN